MHNMSASDSDTDFDSIGIWQFVGMNQISSFN